MEYTTDSPSRQEGTTYAHGDWRRYAFGEPCRCDSCRAAWAAYHRERRKRQRDQALDHLGGSCWGCGNDDPDVLQFDHIKPRSVTGAPKFSSLMRGSWDRLVWHLNEHAQLLCEPCHYEKSLIEGTLDPGAFGNGKAA